MNFENIYNSNINSFIQYADSYKTVREQKTEDIIYKKTLMGIRRGELIPIKKLSELYKPYYKHFNLEEQKVLDTVVNKLKFLEQHIFSPAFNLDKSNTRLLEYYFNIACLRSNSLREEINTGNIQNMIDKIKTELDNLSNEVNAGGDSNQQPDNQNQGNNQEGQNQEAPPAEENSENQDGEEQNQEGGNEQADQSEGQDQNQEGSAEQPAENNQNNAATQNNQAAPAQDNKKEVDTGTGHQINNANKQMGGGGGWLANKIGGAFDTVKGVKNKIQNFGQGIKNNVNQFQNTVSAAANKGANQRAADEVARNANTATIAQDKNTRTAMKGK